ncbi:MAG: GatB/YqeY domain-containing protein [Chloroflexi bacterium]|nr:MAG: aspartyl-tRNA amidotransferase [Anaerolineaceae bacterium 4572_32.2]RLC73952.1 MAG: GatB/YqeY domain-containing protein [Chloroflexota bacterium]RLC77993.1 MAG: GatB/YqeY domain-containing protein [Chloroflexota bacterium]HEY72729.1 GatB/YqeY domain-containing protein [Thermoflexia bacterium]
MNLEQRLQDDLKDALRARDERRKSVIRMAQTAITYAKIEHKGDLDDVAVTAVLQKQAKQRRDTIAELKETDRTDLLAEEEAELEILKEYLPRLLSREEIIEEAQRIIAEVGATGMGQMGMVMRQLMPKLKGRADGRTVNEVVRELLSG